MESKYWLIICAVVALVIAVPLVGFKATGYSVCKSVSSESVETYVEEEPYTSFEIAEEPVRYVILKVSNRTSYRNHLFYEIGQMRIKNMDNVPGMFTVKANFERVADEWYDAENKSYEVSHVIEPLSEVLFYFEYPQDINDVNVAFSYAVEPPTKEVTSTTTALRNVTKYRTVDKPQVTCL